MPARCRFSQAGELSPLGIGNDALDPAADLQVAGRLAGIGDRQRNGPTGRPPSAPGPGPSTTRSSPGPRQTSARSASTTAPGHTSASAAAAAYGHPCGCVTRAPRSTCPTPTACAASGSLRPWAHSRKSSARASRPPGSPPTTPAPTRSRSGCARKDLARPVVQDLLRATFEILDPGAIPWSERHPEATAQAGRAAAGPFSADSVAPDESRSASSSGRS
jgi:hypothetical protein